MALSLALAESEIKRKQTESLLVETQQVLLQLQKTSAEQAKKIEEYEKPPVLEGPKNESKTPRQEAGKAVN